MTISNRRNQTLACWNGFFWYFGNTLISTTLILYIFFQFISGDIGWKNLVTACLLACPQITGAIRLLAPKTQSKRLPLPVQAAGWYTLSGLVLMAIPLSMTSRESFSSEYLITLLIIMWTVHHVSEYFGTITLNTWFGSIVPSDQTGTFYARRERYLLSGAIAASMVTAAVKFCPLFTSIQESISEHVPLLLFWAFIGSTIIILSNIPLLFCSDGRTSVSSDNPNNQHNQNNQNHQQTLLGKRSRLFSPLTCGLFLLFLFYGVSFSFVNGLTQTAQYQVTYRELALSFEFMMLLNLFLKAAQWAWSFLFGRLADRIKTLRYLMVCSQISAAAGLCMLALSTRQTWFLVIPAWLFFSGYNGLNIGIPRYLQYLGQVTENRPACFSLYYAFGGAVFGTSLILSGIILDMLDHYGTVSYFTSEYDFSFFAVVLLGGTALRLLLAPLLAIAIREK